MNANTMTTAPMPPHNDARTAALIAFFEQMSADDVPKLARHYTERAFFKDPFNEVHDLAGVQRVYADMFTRLDTPRFEVLNAVVQDQQCVLTWNLLFQLKGKSQQRRIHGASHLRFADDGRVCYHRDYWDAAGEFYEKLPLVGSVLRAIKQRLKV